MPSSSSSSSNALSRFLEKKVLAESATTTNEDGVGMGILGDDELLRQEEEGERGKTLTAVRSVLHVSRVFGCLASVRIVLEHFLLTYARELAHLLRHHRGGRNHAFYYKTWCNEWREVIEQITPSHSPVRSEIEARFFPQQQQQHQLTLSPVSSVGGSPVSRAASPYYGTASGSVDDYHHDTNAARGARNFESALAQPELVHAWRGTRSIFAVVSADVLQSLLGTLGSGATLAPPGVTDDGELLDPRGETVVVEIKKLDVGSGGRAGGQLRQRVGDWLAGSHGGHGSGRRRGGGGDVMW